MAGGAIAPCLEAGGQPSLASSSRSLSHLHLALVAVRPAVPSTSLLLLPAQPRGHWVKAFCQRHRLAGLICVLENKKKINQKIPPLTLLLTTNRVIISLLLIMIIINPI